MSEPNRKSDGRRQRRDRLLDREYQEAHRYFLHIEATMHDVLKFFSVSLLALISASVALSQFVLEDNAQVPLWGLLGLLWSVFTLVGFMELHYYIELRIRKIKMVEQIAAIRDDYSAIDQDLTRVLRLIPSVVKSPPFLRRPSAEWYSVLYFCAANAGVLTFALFSFIREWDRLPDTAAALILCAASLAVFMYQFWSITVLAHNEDLKREAEVGSSQYNLFSHNKVPIAFQPFNFMARKIELFTRERQKKGKG